MTEVLVVLVMIIIVLLWVVLARLIDIAKYLDRIARLLEFIHKNGISG